MPGNIPRILPPHCKVIINQSRWLRPRIFPLIQERGAVADVEMNRVFNQGIMMVSIVHPSGELMNNPDAIPIGEVARRKTADEPQVELIGSYLDI
ncbi:MAG: phosphoribosylformylglycinamidine cyclo-ligase [Parcubacteria group bacterium Greene0714_36]|nr:MAG: phosphoribosylformylglycinamidine cyclo-ligase [Parcubacteria group bacterium Greene0714_36]